MLRFTVRPSVLALPLVAAALACGAGDRPPETAASSTARPAAAPSTEPAAPPIAGLTPAPPEPSDTTVGVLRDHTLSLDEIRKWSEAQGRLNAVSRQHPDVIRRFESQPPPKTLDEMVSRIQQEPQYVGALGSSGLTPRDYVVTMIALQQGMMGAAARARGQLKELPAGSEGRNIEFVEQHMREIAQLLNPMPTDHAR